MPNMSGKSKRVFLPLMKRYATFADRRAMKVGHPKGRLRMPPALPIPFQLPIDWAKELSFPIDGNDIYDDCYMAAAEHGDNTFTGNNGAESAFNEDLTVSSYLSLAGGDNGLNDGQIISAWENGLPGIAAAKIMDALDIDTTNAQLVQTAIWLFGGVFFGLDVPDNWYKDFTTGSVWDAPANPDSNNGHGVWWNGVNVQGNYHLQTWGTYGWITPAGVSDCDPSGFVVFSQRWFNSSGEAPNGYSYSQLAALWTEMGGKTLPAWPNALTQADRLLPGQGLMPGGSIKSSDSRFTLVMQSDGNLVLYGPQSQPLWASNTAGHTEIFDAIMQGDGNLVLYSGQNQPIWASNTSGKPGAWLVAQSDGNAVIYNSNNQAIWASNTVVPAEPAPPTQTSRLLPGQGLMPGGSIKSSDGRFTFVMQGDGNLVLYGPGGEAMWASNTAGHAEVWDVIMQSDGNLVVYDGHGHALWASNTSGKPGAWCVAQNDGNVVIYDANNQPLWATNTVVPAEPAAPTQADRLLPNQGLLVGHSIKSADGRFTFVMQGDGNLVLYGPSSQPLWASDTNGKGNVWDVVMQSDGNLVVYDGHGHALWASNTSGKPGAFLVVQNDGNVVIYGTNNQPLWATNTVVPAEPAAPTQSGGLLSGQGLMAGGSIASADQLLTLVMQLDGNLVLYDWYNQALWASKTSGHTDIWAAVMQGDGNLVVYDGHNHALWASNTSGKPVAFLAVQNDGNMVIYGTNNQPLWATNTEIGVEILKASSSAP
jgi:hypothetical protein